MRKDAVRHLQWFVVAALACMGGFGGVAQALEIKIVRNMTCTDESTVGTLYVDGKEVARTLELPWRNNEPGISRVPPGAYSSRIRTDGDRGFRIELEDVEDRANVQIHVGNYQRQVEGCILVGRDVVEDQNGACMVNHSKDTMQKLQRSVETAAADGLKKMSKDWVEIHVVVEN